LFHCSISIPLLPREKRNGATKHKYYDCFEIIIQNILGL
jgi:hypothetical protein